MNTTSQRGLTSTLHVGLRLAMVIMCLGIAGVIVGPSGFGWFGSGPAISADGPLADGVEAPLTKALVTVAASSVSPGDAIVAEAANHVRFEIADPSATSRAVWIASEMIGPITGLLGLWLVLGIVTSAKTGQPFTEENERRLWTLASVVGIGGTGVSIANTFARTFVLQRSELADLFAIEFYVSFLPLFAGLAVAVLAGIWRIGVNMSDDLTGTI